MPEKPIRLWYRKSRKCWYVCLHGKQHSLGRDKDEAPDRFHELIAFMNCRFPSQNLPLTGHWLLSRAFHDWVPSYPIVKCSSIQWYWNRIGQQAYPDASSMLLLFDCGGSNSARKYLFKHDLQAIADRTNMTIRVAHYPSYCSKYNPIERRFFPHLSRVCTGMLLDTLDRVVQMMRKATTRTGLRTTVNVIKRIYQTGRIATEPMKEVIRSTVQFADLLPKWNYTFTPQICH